MNRFPKQGRYSDTDIVRYDEVHSIEKIEVEEKSDHPAKDVIRPIQKTLFYFDEEESSKSESVIKPIPLANRHMTGSDMI